MLAERPSGKCVGCNTHTYNTMVRRDGSLRYLCLACTYDLEHAYALLDRLERDERGVHHVRET